MGIRATVVGSFPKVTESGQDNLPGEIDRWQRQLVKDEALEEELHQVTRRVIREQEQAGLDLITEGQIRWEDLAHPIVRSVRGITRGSLRRFFDNNVYYRRLELANGVQWLKSSVVEEFRFASQTAKRPVKVSLPGPLTLVISTQPQGNQSRESLLKLFGELLRKEVETLAAAGAKEIQLEEPALGPGESLLKPAIETIQSIFHGIQARRWVTCYFHDVSALLPSLTQLDVEVLGLDLVTAPKLLEAFKKQVWKKEVALGLIDARNTKLEQVPEVQGQIKEWTKVVAPERLWLSPNCGLEFLPHESALKKLRLLKEAASTF